MIKNLYEKSEIWFAVAWIIAYVVLASTGDNISADIGILKIVTLPILIILSVILFFLLKEMDCLKSMDFASQKYLLQRCCFTFHW